MTLTPDELLYSWSYRIFKLSFDHIEYLGQYRPVMGGLVCEECEIIQTPLLWVGLVILK